MQSFGEWVKDQPFSGLLSEGTLNLMRQSWDASRMNLPYREPVSFVRVHKLYEDGDIDG